MAHRLWLMVAAAALLTASPVLATPLGTLIDTNGTITVGDKVFSNFSLHDVSALNSTPADPRNLQIDGIINLLGEQGLRVSGFSVSLPNSSSSAALIFSLEYDVTVNKLPCARIPPPRGVELISTRRNSGPVTPGIP